MMDGQTATAHLSQVNTIFSRIQYLKQVWKKMLLIQLVKLPIFHDDVGLYSRSRNRCAIIKRSFSAGPLSNLVPFDPKRFAMETIPNLIGRVREGHSQVFLTTIQTFQAFQLF